MTIIYRSMIENSGLGKKTFYIVYKINSLWDVNVRDGAYCNCCLESEHRVDTIVTDEDEILQMSETKYIFTPA